MIQSSALHFNGFRSQIFLTKCEFSKVGTVCRHLEEISEQRVQVHNSKIVFMEKGLPNFDLVTVHSSELDENSCYIADKFLENIR